MVTGAPKDPDRGNATLVPQSRADVRHFVRNQKWVSLFFQTLSAHFDVVDVHGLPIKPGGRDCDHWQGYCTHGTAMFPTWHRPYIAAYEQFTHLAGPLALQAIFHYDVKFIGGYSMDGAYPPDAASVQDFTVFGYTYPEFQGLDLADKAAVRTTILGKVEEFCTTRNLKVRLTGPTSAI